MTTIRKIHGREVLDSRGRPTVEVEIHAEDGAFGIAIAPSGASTGSSEVMELRDGNSQRYDGMGVLRAVENVNTVIAPALIGKDSADQCGCDTVMKELDPSSQKTSLGGNATIAVSLALGHVAAASKRVPLYQHLHQVIQQGVSALGFDPALFPAPVIPLPETNMISGGLHAGGNLDFQDVLIAPVGAPDYRTCLEWIVRVYNRLGKLLSDRGFEGYLVGDEGGYGPRLTSNRDAVALVTQAIEAAGLIPGNDVAITLDVASTHFYKDGKYRLRAEQGRVLSSSEMIDELESWVDEFPIISIEDGLAEDDWEGWQELQQRLGQRILLVGDDLFTTNPARVRRGIEMQAANSVLVKVNQIGTLYETIETMALGRQAGFSLVVSARSGETEDSTLADLATAAAGEQIKVGSIVRSERLAKYNRLLQIAEDVPDFQNVIS
ncbi:MAG: phosphopyruvate hydratase [Planctomycetaceae bacterium]|nr:phosphopyruvate hydratase [Planctomycetaceae bacterium]